MEYVIDGTGSRRSVDAGAQCHQTSRPARAGALKFHALGLSDAPVDLRQLNCDWFAIAAGSLPITSLSRLNSCLPLHWLRHLAGRKACPSWRCRSHSAHRCTRIMDREHSRRRRRGSMICSQTLVSSRHLPMMR